MLYNPKLNKCALLFKGGVTPSANSPISIASQGVTGDSALHPKNFCQPNPIQKAVPNFPPSYIFIPVPGIPSFQSITRSGTEQKF